MLGSAGGGSSPSSHHHEKHHHQTSHHSHHHHHDHRPKPATLAGVPAADMPRRGLTPGVALPVGSARICRSGYASRVRHVPDSLKQAVYDRYGVTWVPDAHEIDHLISLELGGAPRSQRICGPSRGSSSTARAPAGPRSRCCS